MTIFRVMFHGSNVVVPGEDGDLTCGFHVNEYVRAADENDARKKARQKVEHRLKTDAGIRITGATLASLRVEEVEAGASWLKLFGREGLSIYTSQP